MELTIYNTYVVMESQEQCDRMKQLCIDNNLPILNAKIAFEYYINFNEFFYYEREEINQIGFAILWNAINEGKTKVTEQEFINLLNKHNETSKTK